MQLNFLVSSPDQMVDNMRRRGVATGTAEPLTASQAFNNAAWVMDSTVSKRNLELASHY